MSPFQLGPNRIQPIYIYIYFAYYTEFDHPQTLASRVPKEWTVNRMREVSCKDDASERVLFAFAHSTSKHKPTVGRGERWTRTKWRNCVAIENPFTCRLIALHIINVGLSSIRFVLTPIDLVHRRILGSQGCLYCCHFKLQLLVLIMFSRLRNTHSQNFKINQLE